MANVQVNRTGNELFQIKILFFQRTKVGSSPEQASGGN